MVATEHMDAGLVTVTSLVETSTRKRKLLPWSKKGQITKAVLGHAPSLDVPSLPSASLH